VPPGTFGSARYLTIEERCTIPDLLREGVSRRQIAKQLGRDPSTISREVARNTSPQTGRYTANVAQRLADARLARPHPSKIADHAALLQRIEDRRAQRWSPEQISRWLKATFPTQPEMQVCHEMIYQALYVQGRGALRRDLRSCLRTGRARRKRCGDHPRPRFAEPPLLISERPPEVADRAVPGHWEGDLIIGQANRSAIGTLVERTTRYVLLVHLPELYDAPAVRDGLITAIRTLPVQLKQSLTWDQGSEMTRHHEFSIATGLPVYFCDPGSSWQRGSNENTNGLVRQYFPKGTDLSVHSAAHLQTVARELNERPRKTLGWISPAAALDTLLSTATTMECDDP
jgi:IS30 family transposase